MVGGNRYIALFSMLAWLHSSTVAATRCKTEVPLWTWSDSIMEITALGFGTAVKICEKSDCTSLKKQSSRRSGYNTDMVLQFRCLWKKGCGDFMLSTPDTAKGVRLGITQPNSNCTNVRTNGGGTAGCNGGSIHGPYDGYHVEAGVKGWTKVDVTTPVSCWF